MKATITAITFDTDNALELAGFWAAVTGWDVGPEASVHFATVGGEAKPADAPLLMFSKVPEGKTAKNRVHLDLGAEDPEAAVARFLELGATHLWDKDEWNWQWTTLQDPEGNEFCVSKFHSEA